MESFEQKLNTRINSLKEDIESGYEYKNNKDIKDNHIQNLEERINSSHKDSDAEVLEKELDEFRAQKYNADILNENIQQIDKLEVTQGLIDILN